MRTTPSTTPPRRRPGFTLVELLVVIAIIGILAALLIPAIQYAFAQAKQARYTLEIANIEKALERYKIEYGEYPPDFSEVTLLSGTAAERGALAQSIMNNHLSRVFRYRNAAEDLPIGPDLNARLTQLAGLDPSEALVAWLRGFSPDPQHPVFGDGDRTPFFDFDETRLNDTDGDGLFEYSPKGSPGKVPYLYYRADPNSASAAAIVATKGSVTVPAEFRGYINATAWAAANNKTRPYYQFKRVNLAGNPSIQAINTQAMLESDISTGLPTVPNLFPYAAHDKFQLISAGLDDSYGLGGDPTSISTAELGNFGGLAYPRADRDNITNFAGGALEDAKL